MKIPVPMRLRFAPLPWLTFVTLICCAILISLGTWQYQRLHWKAGLLVAIDEAANAPPITSLAQAAQILDAGKPLDFRRIELHGAFVTPDVNEGKAFHLMRSNGKKYYWRLYQTYKDGQNFGYVATQSFDESSKQTPPRELRGNASKSASVVGYVRIVQKANRFTPKSTPTKNRWFAFNGTPETLDWAHALQGETVETRFFVDQEIGAISGAALPVRMPEIANNHLDYMLTWYSFVIILLVIYALYHKRAGRLGFAKPDTKK